MKREQIRNIFEGIAAGDGDLGSRMASGYPGAKPGYPEPLCTLVELANKFYANGTIRNYSPKEKQEWIEKNVRACDGLIHD